MATFIQADNISTGWLAALAHLVRFEGNDIHLLVGIRKPGEEDPHVRKVFDEFLDAQHLQPISTVASTIFPQALYQPKAGDTARSRLYQSYEAIYPLLKRHPANRRGTYFHRLIHWSGRKDPFNQLEQTIQRLKGQIPRRNPLSSTYEMSLGVMEDDGGDGLETEEAEKASLQIAYPGVDNSQMGFPCLSHISLTYFEKRLHMAAVYRNQFFISKAYGNYVGLSHLLHFICQEIGCEPGELTCLAAHADAELRLGKKNLMNLVQACRRAIDHVEQKSLDLAKI